MSAVGHKRRFWSGRAMSGYPQLDCAVFSNGPKADIQK